MKKARIVLFGEPVLRERALEVNVFHKKFHGLVDTMKYTLARSADGAALAANQIAVLKRVTVINYLGEYHEMVNPVIVSFSGESTDYEGCLSFPGFSGPVPRAERVTVSFHDRFGIEKTIERTGRMARCIQHEIDHLDGILYIDRMDQGLAVTNEQGTGVTVAELLKLAPLQKV